jgi:hypothetical protein
VDRRGKGEGRSGRGRQHVFLRGDAHAAPDPNAVLAALDFQLRDPAGHHGLDQLVDFFNGHGLSIRF